MLFISCAKIDTKDIVVTVILKCSNDDKIQLFYTDRQTNSFNDDQLIAKKIEGKKQFQTVEFKLPENLQLTRLRLDLGEYKFETPFYIKAIKIAFGSNEIKIDDRNLNRFFSNNIYLETKNFRKFERKEVNARYDPFLISTPFLEKKLLLEFR